MYIAVDIGGTNTRVVGVTDLDNPVFLHEPIRRQNSTNYDDDISFIIESAETIAGNKTIDAVGIGLVGELSDDRSTSLHSKNNSHWNGKAFAHDLRQALGCPVFAENDGVAAALGEAYYGSISSDFAYVIWGTGIGGALVTHDGQHKPTATILDWYRYFQDWEYACGGSEIANLHGKRPEDFTATEWYQVLDKCRAFALHFIEDLKPQAVVFGGGLSVLHAEELRRITTSVGTPCSVTSFGGNGGLYGAFGVIRHALDA